MRLKLGLESMKKTLQTMQKKNPKRLYSYLNSKKVIKDNIRALNDENGKRIEDPTQIVKILNEQFKSVFEIDNGEKPDFVREKRVYN